MIEALIFHKIGHYLQWWLSKEKPRTTFGRNRYFFEMGGVLMNFGLAVFIVLLTTFMTKDRYLLNENAIYGIRCSELAKEIGFRDGDKIISINGENIEYFSDNVPKIMQYEASQVLVKRDPDTILISISDKAERFALIDNPQIFIDHKIFFTPKLCPDSIVDISSNCLIYTEKRRGFKNVVITFEQMFKAIKYLVMPQKPERLGGFISVNINNFIDRLQLFALNSLMVGLINLIPLPGLDAGNAMIVRIEQSKKRTFNKRKLRIIRIVCSILVVVGFLLYMGIIHQLVDKLLG
ncbi:MAG: M50 family metallopeptidase [Bacteroidales bacterium]|jgi:membrane-associated protease RseP (regulator of RpoE activity)|nr:M50 family metallopeptidase [Bacteroidales bacterium]